jgi:hypothetical protein
MLIEVVSWTTGVAGYVFVGVVLSAWLCSNELVEDELVPFFCTIFWPLAGFIFLSIGTFKLFKDCFDRRRNDGKLAKAKIVNRR